MRAVNGILLSGGLAILAAAQAQGVVVNYTSDMSTKTGWTAVQGGDSGYVAAPDFANGVPSHSSVTASVSERQAVYTTNLNVGAVTDLTFSFRVMLHNTIAGVNEFVGRAGMLDNSGTATAGQIINAFVTLRRAGAIELTVQAADGIGGFTNIVNTNASMPNSDVNGLSGYAYADFTVTRDSTGLWELDVVNGYGNNVMNFSATESTVAPSSNLSKVWVYDASGQWNGAETALYWDNIQVESNPMIPEPASLGLLSLGALILGARRRV
jgi:hypothetical protein